MNKPKKQKDRKSRAQVILHQKWKIVIPGKMEGVELGEQAGMASGAGERVEGTVRRVCRGKGRAERLSGGRILLRDEQEKRTGGKVGG